MTPYTFAKAECANMQTDGSCLGVRAKDLIDRGQRKILQPRELCLLRRPGKRCRYFEVVVLPLADRPSPKDDPKLQARRLRAREVYWDRGEAALVPKGRRPDRPRRCPDCDGPLAKGRRFCSACAGKRRRETYRRRRGGKDRPAPQLFDDSGS